MQTWQLIIRFVFFNILSYIFYSDIDECTEGTHLCDENAKCDNTDGNHVCTCNTGFSGNGSKDNCKGKKCFTIYCLEFDIIFKFMWKKLNFGISFHI